MKPFQSKHSQIKHSQIEASRKGASTACAVALGVMAALSGAQVAAVEKLRFDYQGAAAVCQPSKPLYEPGLRSRPLGLANAGTGIAFVTCTLPGSDPTGQRGAYQVQVNITNNDTVAKFITCTLVVVYRKSGETVNKTAYRSKTINLGGGGGGFISWVPTDLTGEFGGPEISKSGISCGMPAKTTLQYTGNYYEEEVGS